jgi:hypothetical protein
MEVGTDPLSPKSIPFAAIAVLTSRPDSNRDHWILVLGKFFSINPIAFANSSGLGTTWKPIRNSAGSAELEVDVGLEQAETVSIKHKADIKERLKNRPN